MRFRDGRVVKYPKFLVIFVALAAAGCAQSGVEKAKSAAEKALVIADAATLKDEAWLEARALAQEAVSTDPSLTASMAGVIGRSLVLGPDNDDRVGEAESYLLQGLEEDNRLNWLLANGYDNGWFGEVDKAKACDHYLTASVDAKITGDYWPTALCYLNGTRAEKDEQIAFDWMTKSAKAGDQSGMVSLAVLYATGQGTDKDYNQASTWYETAIRAKGPNRAQALRGLGAMHLFELEDGIHQRGYALLELAREDGDDVAKRLLLRVADLDETQRKAVDVQKSFLSNFYKLDDSLTGG